MKKQDYLRQEVLRIIETRSEECFEWKFSRTPRGYGKVIVDGCLHYAHRYALFMSSGRHGEVAAHSCDNPSCINPRHLRWTDVAGNLSDMADRKRSCLGKKNHMTKISEEVVREIRDERKNGESQRSISKRHGVSRSQVGRIISGECWGWVS